MSTKIEYEFTSYCEQLADGELHIFKKDNDYYCFDVNEAHTIYKMDELADGEEYHIELKPYKFDGYSVCVFFYPNSMHTNWLQLFYGDKELSQINTTDYTISKLK